MKVRVTNHAVERYMERVRPGLDFTAAKTELLAMIRQHGVRRERPDWLHISFTGGDADAWVAVSEDVWLLCATAGRSLVATTVVCRGHLSPEAKAIKRAEKRERRRGRQFDGVDRAAAVRRREREQREGAWAA